MKTSVYCHKCPHDGKGRDVCLSCRGAPPEYSFKRGVHLGDEADRIPAPDPSHPPDGEVGRQGAASAALHRFVYDFMSLSLLEVLFLWHVLHGRSLSAFCDDIAAFVAKHSAAPMTRQHAYGIRERVIAKLGDRFAGIASTAGQRRPQK